MNRRQFTKSSALALAATRFPSVAQGETRARPIGFVAVSLGSISGIFMKACAKSQAAKITTLVTGHPAEKGIKYAEMYGIPKSSPMSSTSTLPAIAPLATRPPPWN